MYSCFGGFVFDEGGYEGGYEGGSFGDDGAGACAPSRKNPNRWSLLGLFRMRIFGICDWR